MIQDTNLKDSYLRQYRRVVTESPVHLDIYMRIVSGFIKFKIRKMFEGFDVRLGAARTLGTIGIRGKFVEPRVIIITDESTGEEKEEIRGVSIDWKNTRELWKSDPEAGIRGDKIYHLNEHSNGIRYRICWWTTGMNIANKKLYTLNFTLGPKGNKRRLARLVKDENKEYLVLSKHNQYYGY